MTNAVPGQKRIGKNTFFLFLGEAVSKALGLVLIIYIAKILGDIGYGKYAFAFAFTSMLLVITDLGIGTLIIREVSRDNQKAPQYLGSALLIKFILSLLYFAVISITINLMGYPDDTTNAVYIFGLAMIFSSFNDLFRVVFRAYERMQYEMITRISANTLTLALAGTVLFLGYGLVQLALAFLVARAVVFFFSLGLVLKKFTVPRLITDVSFYKVLFKSALPLGLSAIFFAIYFQIDTVMLSAIKGDAPAGWYNAGYQLVLGFLFIPYAYTNALFPVFSRYFHSSLDNLKTIWEVACRNLLILALPFSIGTTLVARQLILFLYDTEYLNSIGALQVLAWAGSLIFLANVLGSVMIAINRQKTNMYIVGASAVVNIILNLALIPAYSHIGAAIATVITNSLVLVFEYLYLRKYLGPLPLLRMTAKPLAAAIIMGIIVYILSYLNCHVFVIIIVAMAVYAALLFLFRAVTMKDVKMITTITRKDTDD